MGLNTLAFQAVTLLVTGVSILIVFPKREKANVGITAGFDKQWLPSLKS